MSNKFDEQKAILALQVAENGLDEVTAMVRDLASFQTLTPESACIIDRRLRAAASSFIAASVRLSDAFEGWQ